MAMIWFDINKEPLPNNTLQVLARVKDDKTVSFVVLTKDPAIYEKHPWYFDKPYNDGAFYNDKGEPSWNHEVLTHWAYIDPTGIEDDKNRKAVGLLE